MSHTRWWWIRHAPVTSHAGRIYGNMDVDCDCDDEARFRALAAVLPHDAVWIVTPLEKEGHETRLRLERIDFDASFDDGVFTTRNLKNR